MDLGCHLQKVQTLQVSMRPGNKGQKILRNASDQNTDTKNLGTFDIKVHESMYMKAHESMYRQNNKISKPKQIKNKQNKKKKMQPNSCLGRDRHRNIMSCCAHPSRKLFLHGHIYTCSGMCSQFLANEAPQTFQVLAVQLDVVVASSLNPQWLHSLWAALEQGQPMGEVNHLVFCAMNDQDWRCDFGHLLYVWEGIETVGLLGVWEGDPHARGQRRVQDYSGTLISRCQIYSGNGTDALAIQNDVLWTNAIPGPQCMPGCINVCIQILL